MHKNKLHSDDHRFDQYISLLQTHGLQFHPALQPALFQLQNGLLYPGLRVKSDITGATNLVTLPTSLLLTSHKALAQPQLQQLFTDPFYHETALWQDRILITYLLYLYAKKDSDNVWYHMVSNFCRDIDILSFWGQDELKRFEDKSIARAAQLERGNFQREYQEFSRVMKEHEGFFKGREEGFSRELYQWVYVHTVSRCFGSFMNSTYFTPFCQFFNHHCVQVSYQCQTKQQYHHHKNQIQNNQSKHIDHITVQHNQQPINQTANNQTTKPNDNTSQNQQQHHKPITQQNHQAPTTICLQSQQSDTKSVSSISSGNSIDYIEDGDFNYWEVETYKIKWGGKLAFDLKDKETKLVEKLYGQVMGKVDVDLMWKGEGLIFIGQVMEKANIVKNQYMAGRKKVNYCEQELNRLISLVDIFKNKITLFYRNMGFKYNPRTQSQPTLDTLSSSLSLSLSNPNLSSSNPNPTPTTPTTPSPYLKTSHPPTKPYSHFIMQSHPTAHFTTNQQIYFCYGRLSNRTLLIRYGCSIEDNRYDHVWVRLQMKKALEPYPDMFQRLQQKGLPIFYKVKIRPTVWMFQVYLWLKTIKWQLVRHDLPQLFSPTTIQHQIQTFQQILSILHQHLPKYQSYPSYQNLSDPSISYHQYFTRVYHLEKVNILNKHINMVNYVIEKLKEMAQLKKVINCRDFKENKYQKQLKGYWRMLEKGLNLGWCDGV